MYTIKETLFELIPFLSATTIRHESLEFLLYPHLYGRLLITHRGIDFHGTAAAASKEVSQFFGAPLGMKGSPSDRLLR